MAAQRRSTSTSALTVNPDRPLIGIVLLEEGGEVVRYFADEADADAAVSRIVSGSRSLAGVWADLDWEDAVDALDCIRHESEPTAPIDVL